MKAVQLVFACILVQQATAHTLTGEDGSSVDISQDEFCTDVSQYSPKYYEDVVETCCTTVYEPGCKRKNKRVCMDVTNTICKPYAKPNYVIDDVMNPGQSGPGGAGGPSSGSGSGSGNNNGPGGPYPGLGGSGNHGGPGGNKGQGFGNGNNGGNNGGPGSGGAAPNTQCAIGRDSVDMNQCSPKEVNFKHTKKVPECKPVTSLNCETGWKVENGEKVWSGEEECEEVTWQDCKLVDKEVDFPAIESNCGPANPAAAPYAIPVNETANNRVAIPKMNIEQGQKCEAVVQKECVDVPYDDCSEPIRREECRDFNVRKPKQDFIHKKKCLLPQDIERLSVTGGR